MYIEKGNYAERAEEAEVAPNKLLTNQYSTPQQ